MTKKATNRLRLRLRLRLRRWTGEVERMDSLPDSAAEGEDGRVGVPLAAGGSGPGDVVLAALWIC